MHHLTSDKDTQGKRCGQNLHFNSSSVTSFYLNSYSVQLCCCLLNRVFVTIKRKIEMEVDRNSKNSGISSFLSCRQNISLQCNMPEKIHTYVIVTAEKSTVLGIGTPLNVFFFLMLSV